MRWSLGRLFSGEGCLPLIFVEKFIYLFSQQAFTRHLFCVRHSDLCRRRRVPESSRGLFKHGALLAARCSLWQEVRSRVRDFVLLVCFRAMVLRVHAEHFAADRALRPGGQLGAAVAGLCTSPGKQGYQPRLWHGTAP